MFEFLVNWPFSEKKEQKQTTVVVEVRDIFLQFYPPGCIGKKHTTVIDINAFSLSMCVL